MVNKLRNTEDRIFKAACDVFLLYGYHGATFQQIAILAGVNKAAIHYYFRSKEKLYGKIVAFVLANILNTNINSSNKQLINAPRWFIITELYNNKNLFENTLKELYLTDWVEIYKELKRLPEIENVNSYPNFQDQPGQCASYCFDYAGLRK